MNKTTGTAGPGGIVGEAARMNAQEQVRKRRKRLGPRPRDGASIEAEFRQFHEANPEVYCELVRLARRLQKSGQETYGIAGLFEVLRYDRYLSTDGKPFKLSNNLRSRYARLIMEQEADLATFFRTRELTSL